MLPNKGRRRALQAIGSSIGLGVGLPINQVRAAGNQRKNLLPADQTGTVDPKVEKHIPESADTNVATYPKAQARKQDGYINVNAHAKLGQLTDPGPGEISMSGTAWLESTCQARENGPHQVILESRCTGLTEQDTRGANTNVTLTAEPNLAVANADTDTVIENTSEIESNAVNPGATEPVIEHLLTKMTRSIIVPHVGLVGRLLADFILGEVFDHIIEVRPQESQISESRKMSLVFNATKGETYRFRFTRHNGISGQATDDNGWFRALSTNGDNLEEFYVEPLEG